MDASASLVIGGFWILFHIYVWVGRSSTSKYELVLVYHTGLPPHHHTGLPQVYHRSTYHTVLPRVKYSIQSTVQTWWHDAVIHSFIL